MCSVTIKSIWVPIKDQIYIHICQIVIILCLNRNLMRQTLGHIDDGMIISGIQFQPVPLSTLYKLLVLTWPSTRDDSQRLGANDVSNMSNQLGAWDGLRAYATSGTFSHKQKCCYTLNYLQNIWNCTWTWNDSKSRYKWACIVSTKSRDYRSYWCILWCNYCAELWSC